MSARARTLLGVALTLALVVPLGWLWFNSLVPGTYAMTELGYADFGGGHTSGHGPAHSAGHGQSAAGTVSVTSLTAPPNRPADVSKTLVARAENVKLRGAATAPLDGYTLNHTSPGPVIRARQGQLVEVRLVNASVPDGVTLHWHGVDVPNAADGVAGATQDAVGVGEEHVYRFVAEDAGTYWYHSHQVSHEQVREGLFGVLVVEPDKGSQTGRPATVDTVAAVHTYSGYNTIGGQVGESRIEAPSGSRARVRLVNTNNGPLRAWVSGAPFTMAAVDGTDVHQPSPVNGVAVLVPAGGRADLLLTVPASGARVGISGGTSLVLGPAGVAAPRSPQPEEELDLLTYGAPAPIGFDPSRTDREFEYRIDRRPGFLDGRPGLWWTINGHLFPDVPMFMVKQGDVVQMTITNDSGESHPMHLHGHHAVVLSRDGEEATGSPWWTDSLEVDVGESYKIAFVADNPGIWLDHCHNLPHATEGLVTHLAYQGVTTPFTVGGSHHNEPE